MVSFSGQILEKTVRASDDGQRILAVVSNKYGRPGERNEKFTLMRFDLLSTLHPTHQSR